MKEESVTGAREEKRDITQHNFTRGFFFCLAARQTGCAVVPLPGLDAVCIFLPCSSIQRILKGVLTLLETALESRSVHPLNLFLTDVRTL